VALSNVLEYIATSDQTPQYKPDQPNRRGDFPAEGTAWQTPREYALALLKVVGKPAEAETLKLATK